MNKTLEEMKAILGDDVSDEELECMMDDFDEGYYDDDFIEGLEDGSFDFD